MNTTFSFVKSVQIIGAALLIFAWLLGGLYFGTSGLVYEDFINSEKQLNQQQAVNYTASVDNQPIDIQNTTLDELQVHNESNAAHVIAYKRIKGVYPWFNHVPELVILIITSCMLGALGAVIQLLKNVTIDKKNLLDTHFIALPLLGLLTGMIVLGIYHLLPVILTTEQDFTVRKTTLMFFSLFTGIFSEQFMKWLEEKFESYSSNA